MSKEIRKIQVVPYDPTWPQQYEDEAKVVAAALGDNCVEIHHIGSTSVPGLAAKPKIDVIVVVNDPELAIGQLEAVGIEYRGEYNIPLHYGFRRRGEVNINFHVYQQGHTEIELNLMFRDYLRGHPSVCDEYAALKHGLLRATASSEITGAMFTGYNLGKDAFIRKVLQEAGFRSLRFLRCTHYAEWEAAKRFRQHYFFDKVPISDPYTWTFDHPDHIHLVLCLGVAVIGYAHIQLWPESRTALRIIVVDDTLRHRGYGQQFLTWIETWLKTQGHCCVHTESSPDALPFYRKLGYEDMPLDDPDGYESDSRDTPLGKFL